MPSKKKSLTSRLVEKLKLKSRSQKNTTGQNESFQVKNSEDKVKQLKIDWETKSNQTSRYWEYSQPAMTYRLNEGVLTIDKRWSYQILDFEIAQNNYGQITGEIEVSGRQRYQLMTNITPVDCTIQYQDKEIYISKAMGSCSEIRLEASTVVKFYAQAYLIRSVPLGNKISKETVASSIKEIFPDLPTAEQESLIQKAIEKVK